MEIRWYARYVPDGPRDPGPESREDGAARVKKFEQLLASLAEFTHTAKLEDGGAIGAGFTADQAEAGYIDATTAALAHHGYSPDGVPRVICDCGYLYPPGASIGGSGEVLDPIVESGGRSAHPASCVRSEAPARTGAIGAFQQQMATWGRYASPKRRPRR